MDWQEIEGESFKNLWLTLHVHLPKEKKKKLDDRSEKVLMVSYHPTSGYRLIFPTLNGLIISREVWFDKNNI